MSAHERVDGDMSVKAGAGDDCGIPGTPRHVKAPLIGGGDLALNLGTVRVPAEDAVIFAAREQKIRVLEEQKYIRWRQIV